MESDLATMLNLLKNTIYVRVRAQKIVFLHIETGKEFSMKPEMAIDQSLNAKKSILAIGDDASAVAKNTPNAIVANGFLHPRALIADFTVAEQTLKYGFKLIFNKSLFSPSPIVIFHLLEKDEGDYTQVEIRAFEELCRQVGARKVIIKVGAELSKETLLKISETGNDAY